MLCSCSDNISGTWQGECVNITAGNITAPMKLMLNIRDNEVTGSLILGGGDLVGSGSIVGIINGDSITFQSEGDQTSFTHITWMGTISGNVIEGTYRVEPTIQAHLMGIPPQDGRFRVSK